MKYIDKTFFKFLLGLIIFIILGLAFVYKVNAALININTAGVTELKELNGIGDVKAQAIIDYRVQNGPFQKIEDIGKVSGIPLGGTTYTNIKDFITVGEVAATSSAPQSSTPAPAEPTVFFSSAPVTDNKPKIVFEIGAGRDRLSAVNTPLEFRATANTEDNRVNYTWNFGDGAVAYGKQVRHAYTYPGEYVVVLNAVNIGERAISRVSVKIVNADIVVSLASSERIEVMNNGKTEINLFGRGLSVGEQVFVFPEDTIVKAGQKISFSNIVTRLTPNSKNEVSLVVMGENGKIVKTETLIVPSPAKNITNLATPIVAVSISDSTNMATSTPVKSSFFKTLKRFLGFKN